MEATPQTPASMRRLQQLRPVIEQILELSGTVGASVGVIHNGKTLYTDNFGFRDVAYKSVANSQTIYGIGSLTKAMVAAGIGQLVAEGKLTWATPVKDIIPDFKIIDSSVTNLTTVVDLLSHRSGLSGDISLTFQGDGDALLPNDQLLPTIRRQKMATPFRNKWSYSSWGYSVAGLIIERLSGKRLDEFLGTKIFSPLGMTNTTTQPVFKAGENVAEPYSTLENATPYHLKTRMQFNNTFFEPAAGAFTNVDDMLLWANAVLKASVPTLEQTSESILKEMDTILSSQIALMGPSYRERSYAMGWIRTQLPGVVGVMGENVDILGSVKDLPELGTGSSSRLCLYHQGATAGYYSAIFLLPETQTAVIVLTNSIPLSDSPDNIGQAIIQALFDFPHPIDFVDLTKRVTTRLKSMYKEIATVVEKERKPGTTGHPLIEYTGRYMNELGNFLIDITEAEKGDGILELSFQGLKSQVYELRPFAYDTFEWLLTLDEESKRGRYHIVDGPYFSINFLEVGGTIKKLEWAGYVFAKEYKALEASHVSVPSAGSQIS